MIKEKKDKIKQFVVVHLLDALAQHWTNDFYMMILTENGKLFQMDSRTNKWTKIKPPKDL